MKKGRVKEELKRKERHDSVEKHKRKKTLGKKKKEKLEMEKNKSFTSRTNARSLPGFVPVQVSPVRFVIA